MDTIGSRICFYLLSSAFVSMFAGGVGAGIWDAGCQADEEASDCDAAGLYFIGFAVVAFAICCVVAVVLEHVLAWRRTSR